MTSQSTHDPRPLFARSLAQAEQQVVAVSPNELTNPTPCTDYDVRALLGHMLAVLHRIARLGAEVDAADIPDVLDGIADHGWAEAFAQGRREAEHAWVEDAKLDRPVVLPWATMSGRDALDAYTYEFTVHSWDLAHATGRTAGLDPELGELALHEFGRFAPPEQRSEQGPFKPVVPAPEDADVYTRLAAYLGRRP